MILGVHSFFDSSSSEMSSSAFGHSWISIENDSGVVSTYGLWPSSHDDVTDCNQQEGWNGSGTAVRENIEIMNGSHGHDSVSNYHWALTEEQASTLNTCLNEQQTWGMFYNNCATWTNDVCHKVTGEHLCSNLAPIPVTPSDLQQALDAKTDALTQDIPTQAQQSSLEASSSSSWGTSAGDGQAKDSGMGM